MGLHPNIVQIIAIYQPQPGEQYLVADCPFQIPLATYLNVEHSMQTQNLVEITVGVSSGESMEDFTPNRGKDAISGI